MNTMVQAEEYEEALIQILRRLPPERVSEVLDFAQFLEFQAAKVGEEAQEYIQDDARWDALLATEESQRLLEKMADTAMNRSATHLRPMKRAWTEHATLQSRVHTALPRTWFPGIYS